MSKKRSVVTLSVAAVAAAALIAVGVVYQSSDSSDSSNSSAQAGVAAKALGDEDLRGVLLPPDQHPPGTVVSEEAITVQRAVGEGLLTPAGMTFAPERCITYFDESVGGIGSLTGYIQYGTRPDDPSHHSDVYSHTVLAVPGGGAIDRIRANVGGCGNGSVTLESRVTGTIVYREIPAPALPGAQVLALQSLVTFPCTADEMDSHLVAAHGFVGCETCSTEVYYVEYGETLIEIVEPSNPAGVGSSYADEMAAALYNRVLQASQPTMTAVSPAGK